MEQARTSHTLDREGILRRHAKWDALTTAVEFHYKGTVAPPSLEEVWDLDVQDQRERIRVHMKLSPTASAQLWALCTTELVELCAGLQEEGGTLWPLVEAYLDFGGAHFFRLDYSPYGRNEGGGTGRLFAGVRSGALVSPRPSTAPCLINFFLISSVCLFYITRDYHGTIMGFCVGGAWGVRNDFPFRPVRVVHLTDVHQDQCRRRAPPGGAAR
jgi:hypothetical protein